MIDVLGVLMGVDMQGFSRPEGSDDLPPGLSKENVNSPSSSAPKSTPPASSSTPRPPASTATSTSAPPESEDVEMAEADEEEAKAKKHAEGLKKAGNDAYKKRDFDEAARLFEQAWDIWPKDITFLTNLGGKSCLLTLYISGC